MHRIVILLVCIGARCFSQPVNHITVAEILDFERGRLTGWQRSPHAAVDDKISHGGRYSARIVRNAESEEEYSTLNCILPVDFTGKSIELRGYVKTENVRGAIALWMRLDGDAKVLGFATLQDQKIQGTQDWREYSITVPIVPEGKRLVFGFLLSGSGTGWVDDLRLLVDGRPIAQAAVRPTVFTKDREFDHHSRFTLTSLSATQVANLTTLGRVWGFLKYHHPAITTGTRHWDYDLFRVLPSIAKAPDRSTANAALLTWIQGLGEVPACTPCAELPSQQLHLLPDLNWIKDRRLLGKALSDVLVSIHRNRKIQTSQFYVSLVPNVLNPTFNNEPHYRDVKVPDPGYQLLALFRLWNIVQYFFPYRDMMPDQGSNASAYWLQSLREFIPHVTLADSPMSYKQEMLRFIVKINDTHANLWSSLDARPPVGDCRLPVYIRFIEGKPFVYREIGAPGNLFRGDILTHLEGIPVTTLIERWRPFYAASNEPVRLRDLGRFMTRGACGPVKVGILRGNETMTVDATRTALSQMELLKQSSTHDRPGPAFQKVSDDIAYLKLSGVSSAAAPTYIRDSVGTRGLIIDIRNYPSEAVVFALGSLLHTDKTPFVRFAAGDIVNPGAMHWQPELVVDPTPPHYSGKIVILVDESTFSQAEYTAMAFRAVPGAVVIGSTTAGADGNVSVVPLPGGLQSAISGLGIFYPNKSPTQRVGIKPDVFVTPTIKGLRAGRDELIEAAIQHIMK